MHDISEVMKRNLAGLQRGIFRILIKDLNITDLRSFKLNHNKFCEGHGNDTS